MNLFDALPIPAPDDRPFVQFQLWIERTEARRERRYRERARRHRAAMYAPHVGVQLPLVAVVKPRFECFASGCSWVGSSAGKRVDHIALRHPDAGRAACFEDVQRRIDRRLAEEGLAS